MNKPNDAYDLFILTKEILIVKLFLVQYKQISSTKEKDVKIVTSKMENKFWSVKWKKIVNS